MAMGLADESRTADQKAINWLGVFLTLYLCGLLTYLVFSLISGTVQPDFRDVVIGIVGFVTAKLSTIYDFCFGTSSASKKQQDTIATQAATAKQAQEALAPIVAAAVPGQATPPAPNGARAPGDPVVLQPGQHVDVSSILLKPNDIDQAAWDAMTEADKAAEIAKRTTPPDPKA